MTTEQRATVGVMLGNLQRSLDDARRNETVTQIGRLMVVFPAQQLSESATKVRMQAYLETTGHYPHWAIAEAVSRWIAGDAHGQDQMKFAPSPAELRRAVAHVLRPYRARHEELRRMLVATPLAAERSSGERARVLKELEKFERFIGSIEAAA